MAEIQKNLQKINDSGRCFDSQSMTPNESHLKLKKKKSLFEKMLIWDEV